MQSQLTVSQTSHKKGFSSIDGFLLLESLHPNYALKSSEFLKLSKNRVIFRAFFCHFDLITEQSYILIFSICISTGCGNVTLETYSLQKAADALPNSKTICKWYVKITQLFPFLILCFQFSSSCLVVFSPSYIGH